MHNRTVDLMPNRQSLRRPPSLCITEAVLIRFPFIVVTIKGFEKNPRGPGMSCNV